MRKERAEQPGSSGQSSGAKEGLPAYPGGPGAASLERGRGGSRCAAPRAREPIFSQTHTNEFCGIRFSTQEPAGPCAPLHPGRWVYEKGEQNKPLWGGCQVYLAPLHGSLRGPLLVPFHTSPPSRGALRSAGVPTIAASTTPAPLLPRLSSPARRGIWEDSAGAREYPMCAEGWALWVLGGSPDLLKSHRGYLPVGEAFRAEPPGRASSWGA